MTSPADELRAAAEKIRKLVSAIGAPDLPDQSWHVEECANAETSDCPCIVAQGTYSADVGPAQPMFYVADAETPECADYIAAMHPGVGLLLADWLETEGRREAYTLAEFGHRGGGSPHALAVARAILGGQPPRTDGPCPGCSHSPHHKPGQCQGGSISTITGCHCTGGQP